MDDINPAAIAALATIFAVCTITFIYLVWKRQWTWMGLFVATGCLIAGFAHFQILVQLVFQLDYASNPVNIGAVVWQYGLGWGLLLFATSSIMLAAMVAALRPPNRWGAASICLASVYFLWTTGAWSVQRWVSLGDLPSMSFGVEWPMWIGFPAFLLLICGPFVTAIPWSLARQARANPNEAAGVIAQFRVIVGTVAILLTVIGGSVAMGLLQKHWSLDERATRIIAIFAAAQALTIIAASVMMIAFRRSFLSPAISIIEGISSDRPLASAIKPGSLWQPMVDAIDSTRSQIRERGAQLAAFFDNLPTSIYLKTIDHEVIYVSKHLAEQYGKRPEDMVGKYEYDLHIEAMKPHLQAMDEHIMSTGEAVLMEGRHLQFDRLELVSRFPVFNDQGEITHIGGMNFDIDDRAKAQAALVESKALFEAFVENAPNPLALLDINGKFIMTNKAATTYFGLPQDEFLSAGIEAANEHFPEMGTEEFRSMYERVLATRQFEDFETPFIMPSGETHWLRVAAFPILGPDGEVLYLGNIAYDITEVRQAQAALQESKALLDAFIQNAPNSMVLMKPNGQYVLINNAAARYYDKTPEELLAAGPKVLNAPFTDARSKIVPMMARVIANVKEETIETPFVLPSGEVRDTEFMLFPILGADGEVAYVGNISHDVTAERRAQAELAKSTNALHQSEKLAALGSMLAGVSHELNNPLAAVIGQAALLAEDLDGTEHTVRLSKIRRAADRCARIVHSFLAMARQKPPEYRSVSINDQVRSAVELTEYQIRAAQVTLDLRLANDLPNIEADPDELHQVIANLLTNARQALEEVNGERRITLTTWLERDMVRLSVADTGSGIDAAARDRIFDPFFSTKAVGSGTGIGLSYSLGIIEAHGGTIGIEDSDIGSVFVVSLPVQDKEHEAPSPEQAEASKAKGHALVIDDEEDVAETLADMVKRQGLRVTVAIGGLAGQGAMADGAKFDVILSDIRMPDLDGPALYDWMTANRPDLIGAIAFVTGDTLSGIASDFLARSGCPVLEKPFTPAALRELVTAMLKGDRR